MISAESHRDGRESIPYAGIGARATPAPVLAEMREIAAALSRAGWRVRSGGADGADRAFEQGGGPSAEVFLPWPGFNGSDATFVPIPQEAFAVAEAHHPGWPRLSSAVRKLMARNVMQILGADLNSPSRFVLCWTPDAAETRTTPKTGGTGQAIRVAIAHNIPVFNLCSEQSRAKVSRWLSNQR